MKKNIKYLSILLIIGALLITLTSCNTSKNEPKDPATVMNVSLNPEVEFVLDEDGLVVSVNANNEEGNIIISSEEFGAVIGMSAADAVELFVSVSDEYGFLLEGTINSDENELEISIISEGIDEEELYNEIKEKVNEYFSLEKIDATIKKLEDITRTELEKTLLKCEPHLTLEEVQAMETIDIIEAISISREETKEFYSQELKNAYYEAKAYAIEQIEFQTIRNNLNSISQMAFDVILSTYNSIIEEIEEVRYDLLVKEDSIYQLALNDFRTKKADYLNYRNYLSTLPEGSVSEEHQERLNSLDELVNAAEEALVAASVKANEALDKLKETLKYAYDTIIDALTDLNIKLNDYLDQIEVAVEEATLEFNDEFNKDFKENIESSKNNWDNMRDQLKEN